MKLLRVVPKNFLSVSFFTRFLFIAIPIILVTLLHPTPTHAANYAVTVTTDSSSYMVGGIVKVSGTVTNLVGGQVIGLRVDVALVKVAPPVSTITVGTVTTDVFGAFTASTAALSAGTSLGTYRATATVTESPGVTDVGTSTTTILIATAAATPGATAATTAAATPGATPAASAQATASVTLLNPITCGDATCLISQVIRYILGTIAIIATLMFIWGGIMMLTSGGNAEQVKKARETLVWATIGIIVILLSWVIIQFVLKTVAGKSR